MRKGPLPSQALCHPYPLCCPPPSTPQSRHRGSWAAGGTVLHAWPGTAAPGVLGALQISRARVTMLNPQMVPHKTLLREAGLLLCGWTGTWLTLASSPKGSVVRRQAVLQGAELGCSGAWARRCRARPAAMSQHAQSKHWAQHGTAALTSRTLWRVHPVPPPICARPVRDLPLPQTEAMNR